MKRSILAIGLQMSFLFLVSCSNNDKVEKEVEITNNLKNDVTTEEIVSPNEEEVIKEENQELSDNKKRISFNGTITYSPRCINTVTLTMGGSLEAVSVFPGSFVKKGQIIATLKNMEFIELQEEYLTSLAQVEYLEKEYQRQNKLASHEAASQKKLQQSKADFLSEKSRLDATRAQLALLDVDAELLRQNGIKTYLEVKAPISGYITDMQVNSGHFFEAGQSICDIINYSETMLLLTAYERDITHIALGDCVTFTVNGLTNKTFKAEVVAIDPMVNSENRSINVYAKVKNTDKQFKLGMYVSANIEKNI
ncbi:MAG: efflux RND transporter periplasmic adaptor subunit [Parabacteroides sp.]|nr:efflux RND transporter periplasmic adaptor subunit [Parabacteroides sp.]